MDRAAYHADRRAARDRAATRHDLDLPDHPANWWIDCPNCEGAGEHLRNDSDDPQCEYEVTCDRCMGDGVIPDGRIDLLVELRRARRNMTLFRAAPNRFIYRRLRERALSGSPLAQLRMIEAAIRCDVAARAALQAWRSAA